jgi:hypothetical protein
MKTTRLGESQISESPNDTVLIEFVEPDDMPAVVRITWPESPSIVDPLRFRDLAAAMVKLFSDSHVALARIKARRYR